MYCKGHISFRALVSVCIAEVTYLSWHGHSRSLFIAEVICISGHGHSRSLSIVEVLNLSGHWHFRSVWITEIIYLSGHGHSRSLVYFQAYEQMDSLKAQLRQERELRAVTESCLMEDRLAWQRMHHLVSDTRQRCSDVQELLTTMKWVLKIRLSQLCNTVLRQTKMVFWCLKLYWFSSLRYPLNSNLKRFIWQQLQHTQ